MNQTATISIEGMHCQNCAQSVNRAVSSQPGVSSVNVDLTKNAATVTYDPQSTTVAKLMQSVQQAGFKATGFSRSNGADPTAPRG